MHAVSGLHARNFRRRLTAVAALAALAACDSERASSPVPLDAGDIRPFLAPGAAELDARGRFRLAPPAAEPYPQITAEEATEIAVAFSRTFAPYIRPYLERQHRGPIDFDALVPVSPAYYAITPYHGIPAGLHPGIRNHHGPHYLVYLGEDGSPVLSVAVAAFGEARVEGGRLLLPVHGGEEVEAQGVPPGEGFALPPSPEHAVRLVGTVTAARVAAVPELVLPDEDFMPQYARWRIVLDRPVRVRTVEGGRVRQVREVYVGIHAQPAIPGDAQPERITTHDPATRLSHPVLRKPERPTAFERVTLLPD